MRNNKRYIIRGVSDSKPDSSSSRKFVSDYSKGFKILDKQKGMGKYIAQKAGRISKPPKFLRQSKGIDQPTITKKLFKTNQTEKINVFEFKKFFKIDSKEKSFFEKTKIKHSDLKKE